MTNYEEIHAAALARLNALYNEAANERAIRRSPRFSGLRLHIPFTRWTLSLSLHLA